jgi:hypothetical protein
MPISVPKPLPSLFATVLLVPTIANAQVRPRATVQEQPAPTRTLEAVPTAAPAAGPPPQNIGFDQSGTFGVIAKVVWAPAPNAVNYVVKRRLQEDPSCCNATSSPLTATSWTDAGLYKKGNYIFTVLVNYADGSVGSAEVGIGAAGVQNPVLTATDLSPGRVRLTFNNAIPGTSGFIIGGPSFETGKQVSSGPVDTGILPPGTYTWTIASIYSQGLGVLSPASEWSKVTHTIGYGMGRYRISLEGFKAINVTAEDPLRNDGRGDEVFITTQVSEYGRNGSMTSTRMVRTPTFGDKQNFPARVQAGSASPTGGIVPNDQYPAPVQLISQLQPATTTSLPYLLWEGDLTEIDNAVILSPAVWESDEDDVLYSHFATFQASAAPNVPYRNQFNPYVPNTYGRPILDTWNPQKSCPAPLGGGAPTMFVPPISGWRDEPMDMNVDHSYCPTFVAINWKLANSLTTTNPAAVVEIPFKNPTTNWQYTLYVRVEKVAPAKIRR